MPELFDAISRGDEKAVRKALASGENVNRKHQGKTPLEAAIDAKQPAIARRLLEAGADASKSAHQLCVAIGLKDPELVRAILDGGGDPNMRPPGGRPLQYAVKARSPEMVRVLMDGGADVNAGSGFSTPLADAVKLNEEECACLLIQAGAKGDADFPTSVAFDAVECLFTSPIADPDGLARRMYEFCPDIVVQGVGDVDALAETLRESPPRLYFWWD